MKRTHRIEIIRYSRRVTVTTGDDTLTTVLADSTKLPVIDITPGVEEVNCPAPEQGETGSGTNVVSAHEPPRQRLILRLRDLLKSRW